MSSNLIKGDFDKYLKDIAIKIYNDCGESELRLSFTYSPNKLVMVIEDPNHSIELITEYVKILNQLKFENRISYFTLSYDARYLTVNLTK